VAQSRTNPEPNLIEQIINFLKANPDCTKNIKYGTLEFEIKDGKFYKLKLSESMLIKSSEK
jgi:hypothetical protein